MKKVGAFFSVGFLTVAMRVLATEAAHTSHAVPSWEDLAKPLGLRAFNFIVFIALLVVFLRKPLAGYLAKRRKEIEEVIKASAERKAWAEQMYADYNRRLENIGKEIEEIKVSLRQEGESEARRIIEHAQSLAKTLRQEATLIATADLEEFKTLLYHDVIEKSAEVARDTVMQVINDADQSRLAQEFTQELGKERT